VTVQGAEARQKTKTQIADAIETVVRRIPRGQVATYGQVAALAGFPRAARLVGWILHESHESIPWQRVINREGRLSIMHEVLTASVQAQLLREEGVEVVERDDAFWVDLKRYLWQPTVAEQSK